MMRWRQYALLLRQLTAHDAYLIRRVAVEASAQGLARLGEWIPAAALLAARIHPSSKEANLALARHAERRGHSEAARRYRSESKRLAHNTLETSVLGALGNTLAWRRTRLAVGGTSRRLEQQIAEGRLDEAARELQGEQGTLGSRVDASVRLAEAALAAGERTLAREILERARASDPGRSDVWRAVGRLELAEQQLEAASAALERAVALDPGEAQAWIMLGDARVTKDAVGARDAWWRALERDPYADGAITRLETVEGSRTPSGPDLGLIVEPAAVHLSLGSSTELRIETRLGGGPAGLYILEPFGAGLVCKPRGRIPVGQGTGHVALHVRATRPDGVVSGQPWRLVLALCSGERIERVSVPVSVPDNQEGHVYYVVTEDHELYDEREATSAEDAHTTLVDKSRLAEKIANAQGARWTHMVDVGSLALVGWAAVRSRRSRWREVDRACRDHLVEAVRDGNDLGLHCHAFHDPSAPVFCHGFDEERDLVTTSDTFLETPLPRRGFWSRAFPAIGDVDTPGSRAWATWRGIGTLEGLGRLGDPHFRVTIFRAGSFDFGEDRSDRGRSLALLQRLGILADSDVPKPRLYYRPLDRASYPVRDDPREPVASPAAVCALEIRPEFNIEADFLSDVGVLNAYVDDRIGVLGSASGAFIPGTHIVCAMTHDKFINWRMGRRWDCLDPEYGDWLTIRDHLQHVAARHPKVRRATVRDAVLDWYDRFTPTLLAWRHEEIVVLAAPDAETQTYRYTVRLLGRDIPVSEAQPRRVRVHLPAWLHGRVREAWIECDSERWVSERPPGGVPVLEFMVASRAANWQLVVAAEAGSGIVAERDPAVTGGLRLRSHQHYRRATVEIPASLAPDGLRRIVRDVQLEPAEDHYEGRLVIPG